MAVLNVYKPLGWTPLDGIRALREQYPEHADAVMTYVGRLDPMAEGVLLILTDEDRFRREEFMGLPKTYEATMLFGYRSDTYDALGVPEKGSVMHAPAIEDALQKLPGTHALPFPAYSSYRVQGKPLHWWAQQGRLSEVAVPKKLMRVDAVRDVVVATRSSQDVREQIVANIFRVHGDFRQKEIAQRWESLLLDGAELAVASCTLHVASGTYVRALAEELGQQLGCGALLLGLTRTSVGSYTQEHAERIEGERQGR